MTQLNVLQSLLFALSCVVLYVWTFLNASSAAATVSFSLGFLSHPLHLQGNRMDEQRCTFPPPLKVELPLLHYLVSVIHGIITESHALMSDLMPFEA